MGKTLPRKATQDVGNALTAEGKADRPLLQNRQRFGNQRPRPLRAPLGLCSLLFLGLPQQLTERLSLSCPACSPTPEGRCRLSGPETFLLRLPPFESEAPPPALVAGTQPAQPHEPLASTAASGICKPVILRSTCYFLQDLNLPTPSGTQNTTSDKCLFAGVPTVGSAMGLPG